MTSRCRFGCYTPDHCLPWADQARETGNPTVLVACTGLHWSAVPWRDSILSFVSCLD